MSKKQQGNRTSKTLILLAVACFFLITNCTTKSIHPKHGTALDQMRADLAQSIAENNKLAYGTSSTRVPPRIARALMPPLNARVPTRYPSVTRRFDIAANKIPAKEFFMQLVEGTPYNMVVHPTVTGEITLSLKHVTLDEAMQAVRDAYGYEYHKTSYGFEVLPQTIQSQMFTVNYIDVKRFGKSFVNVTSGQISDEVGNYNTGNSLFAAPTQPVLTSPTKPSGSSVETRSEINFWKDLESTLKTMVGNLKDHSVVVNAQAGLVIVRAYPNELRQVARYLDRIQTNLDREVIIEAKILEVDLDDQFHAGIDWNLFGQVAQNEGGLAQLANQTFDKTGFTDFNGIFTLRINGDFGALIRILSLQGQVQVLSSPRISTVNNQKAVIKVGQDEFFVTGVSTTTNVVVGNSAFPTQNVNLTPFFSGITLDVTPQISRDENIILHIHPTISDVRDQQKTIDLGTVPSSTGGNQQNILRLPMALSKIRESDNIVRAKSKQIIVIGGLMQNNMTEDVASIPYISKIPVIGPFFRRTQQTSRKTELVILLRPIIVSRRVWNNDMREVSQTLDNMNRGFHSGGLPEVFGNEADNPPNQDNATILADSRPGEG